MKQILTSNKQRLTSVLLMLGMLLSPAWSRADIYITGATDGTFTFNGSFDISAYAPANGSFVKAIVRNNTAQTRLFFNSADLIMDGFFSGTPFITTAHPYFNSTTNNGATLVSHTGDFFGFETNVSGSTQTSIFLPRGYVSGTEISGTTTFSGGDFGFDFDTPYSFLIPGSTSRIFLNPAATAEPPKTPTIEVLLSTFTTGLAVPNAAQSVLTSAPQTALNTINNRLLNARSRVGNPRGNGGSSLARAGHHNSSFFNFSRQNGLNLSQALGFEDVPVAAEVADSETSFMLKGLTIETQIGATIAPESEAKPWEIYTSGDYHSFDQDAIGAAQPGFDSDTFTGTVGAEYNVNEKLNIGLGYSYLDNSTRLGNNFGRVDVEGHLATAYATYFWDNNYVDVLYSRANFENSLTRNVPGGTALGTPDSMADIVNVNLGRNMDLGNGFVTGPLAGLDYTHGVIDAYTETGPAAAILAYQKRSYESLVTRLGWQASKTQEVECGRLTIQGSLAWEKEHKPESDSVNAALVAFPTLPFNLTAPGANPGTDWLNLGLGASLMTRSGVEVGVNYQSQLFRTDVTSHYIGAKIAVKF